MSDVPETSLARMQVEAPEEYPKRPNETNSEYIWEHLSAEQKLAASESLTVYCKPVEIYNRLRERDRDCPRFLQRCLDYKIKDKHKKRILMTVLLSWKEDETQFQFPLCIYLGRLDPNEEPEGGEKYHVDRIFTFQGPSGVDWNGNNHVQVNFMLPQPEKLAAETTSEKYFLFILASAESPISLSTINASTLPVEVSSNEPSGGEKCLYAKVSLKFLHDVLIKSPNSSLRRRTKMQSSVNFSSCIMKYFLQHCTRTKSRTISIRDSNDSEGEGKSKRVQILIGFEESGAAREPPPHRRKKMRKVASSSPLPHIAGLSGSVSFHYRYYHNILHNMEVTENFTCAICLTQCATYKGLKYHLTSSHELFDFEFSELEEFPSVYLSVKNFDIWWQQWADPRLDTFMYCAKKPNRRKLNTISRGRNNIDKLILDAQLLKNLGSHRTLSISDSNNGSHAIQQIDPDEVSNGCVLPISHQDVTHGVLEVDLDGVLNARRTGQDPCQDCVLSDQNGTRVVLELDRGEVSNAIVLHTAQDCVPPIADLDNGTDPYQDCVPSISDQHGTRGVLEVDHEQVSNAIILYTGQDFVPPISDCVPSISDQDGTRGVLEEYHEEVSKAIVLYTGQGCVSPISEHGNGTHPYYEECVPSISDQDGRRGVPEVGQEEVSNAIVLYTGQDCVPPISDHDNGVRAMQEDNVSNAIILHPGMDSVPSIPSHDGATSSATQVEEKEKSLIELFDPNLLARWKKRTFYHSHTHQAMALEEVVEDEDSEDEINEGAQEIQDRRRLELLGISEAEKRLLTMWSSFVKKHRVLADGHMNWAYEAFTKYSCPELAQSPSLAWSWRLFMIKLYDQGLLKTKTVCTCSAILEQYRKQN